MEKDSQMLKENKKSFKRFIKSFKYCAEGIRYAFYHEQNIIVMLVIGILTLLLGLVFDITMYERLIIILTIGVVLSLEMINTAIEAATDLIVDKKQAPLAKVAKDCASGAVGIMSIFAAIIGLSIYLPKIFELLGW